MIFYYFCYYCYCCHCFCLEILQLLSSSKNLNTRTQINATHHGTDRDSCTWVLRHTSKVWQDGSRPLPFSPILLPRLSTPHPPSPLLFSRWNSYDRLEFSNFHRGRRLLVTKMARACVSHTEDIAAREKREEDRAERKRIQVWLEGGGYGGDGGREGKGGEWRCCCAVLVSCLWGGGRGGGRGFCMFFFLYSGGVVVAVCVLRVCVWWVLLMCCVLLLASVYGIHGNYFLFWGTAVPKFCHNFMKNRYSLMLDTMMKKWQKKCRADRWEQAGGGGELISRKSLFRIPVGRATGDARLNNAVVSIPQLSIDHPLSQIWQRKKCWWPFVCLFVFCFLLLFSLSGTRLCATTTSKPTPDLWRRPRARVSSKKLIKVRQTG